MGHELDAALIKRALAGDRAARQTLARRLLHAIQREVSFGLVRFAAVDRRDPRQEVLDLVQNVIVTLFEHDARELRRWDPNRGRSLESFVRLIARRQVARTLGQRVGNPWADRPVDPHSTDAPDTAPLAPRLEDRHTLDRLLGALYATMNERDHELFELLWVHELDPQHVATRLGLSRGAVNAWAYRFRKQARALAQWREHARATPSSESNPTPNKDGAP